MLSKGQNNKELQKIKSQVVSILKKNGIEKAGIFGSFARGEQKKTSDVDIIIKPRKKMGFGFFGIQIELEEKLGKKVDLVTYKGLSPYLKDSILKDEVRLI